MNKTSTRRHWFTVIMGKGVIMNSWVLRCIHLHHENRFVQCVIVFLSFFVYPDLDFLWAARWVFLGKQFFVVRVTHFLLYVFICLFYVLCCVCLVSMSGRCPWITFFLFQSWFPWFLFKIQTINGYIKNWNRHIDRRNPEENWRIYLRNKKWINAKSIQ